MPDTFYDKLNERDEWWEADVIERVSEHLSYERWLRKNYFKNIAKALDYTTSMWKQRFKRRKLELA